jgi:hypothetical protein
MNNVSNAPRLPLARPSTSASVGTVKAAPAVNNAAAKPAPVVNQLVKPTLAPLNAGGKVGAAVGFVVSAGVAVASSLLFMGAATPVAIASIAMSALMAGGIGALFGAKIGNG